MKRGNMSKQGLKVKIDHFVMPDFSGIPVRLRCKILVGIRGADNARPWDQIGFGDPTWFCTGSAGPDLPAVCDNGL
jgi:hypothetical protein